MKRIALVLALIALLATYQAIGVLWGRDVKLYVISGILGLYAVLSIALFIMRRRLRREHPELAAEMDADAGAPWYWRILDGVLGVSFAFGPPVIVSLTRRQSLSWESEFTGYHVLALAAGVGVYLLGRAYAIRRYQHRREVTSEAA